MIKLTRSMILFLIIGLMSCNQKTLDTNPTSPTLTLISITETHINFQGNEERDGIQIGNLIVTAVEKYYQDHGSYPRILKDLIPEYLVEIPVTTTYQEYQYIWYEPNSPFGPYIVGFPGINEKWDCAYHAKDKFWECAVRPTH